MHSPFHEAQLFIATFPSVVNKALDSFNQHDIHSGTLGVVFNLKVHINLVPSDEIDEKYNFL